MASPTQPQTSSSNAEGTRRGVITRRALLGASLTAGAAAAAGFTGEHVTRVDHLVATDGITPFFGTHQAGIETPAQAHATFVACNLSRPERDILHSLLYEWTRVAAALTAGKPVPESSRSAPSHGADTDFAEGLDPAGLTITVGFGPGIFDPKVGLAHQRPKHLTPLPEFAGDELNSAWTGGDLLLQICGNDAQVVSHAFRALRAKLPGLGKLLWTQSGFLSRPSHGATPRNMFGHKDGTANPKPGSTALDHAVWVTADDEPSWFRGGSYLVFRKIRMKTAEWDQLPREEQDHIVGRRRSSGAPLTGNIENDPVELRALTADGDLVIPPDAHIRLVHGIPMLRRSYNYDYGLIIANASGTPGSSVGSDERTHTSEMPEHSHGGHDKLDVGLLFAAYMNNPPEQFIKAQNALATDRMNALIQHTGSAFFAMPPGSVEGQSLADGLLG